MKRFFILCSAIVLSGALWLSSAVGSTIVLDFEGLQNYLMADGVTIYNEPVGDFYNGGGGTNYGVSFSSNALGLIDFEAGGYGNFCNEPSGDTIMYFDHPGGVTMNVAAGFDTGFSFYYTTAPEYTGYVNVFDGLDGTGNLLGSLSLGGIPWGPGDPTGFFQFAATGLSFNGTAQSVVFGGEEVFIGFDNITLGDSSPVPEPTTLALIGIGLFCFGIIGRKKLNQA